MHRSNVDTIQRCTTVSQQSELESKLGCRYSALLDLPYFDPVRMTIIDPMHMFLGTAKHILKNVWMKKSLVTDAHLNAMQDILDSLELPPYIGRIPYKMESSVASFTADQFKNWTCYFSLICLRDILPQEHLRCWQCFVLASRIFCQMSLTNADIELADALLLKFCRQVELLYGNSVITPNMHLHGHLKQCLLDYGPVHNFWLFAYERYNGILESYPNNHHSIEVQLMKRFFREFNQSLSSTCIMELQYKDEFGEFMTTQFEDRLEGSLKHTVHDKYNERFNPFELEDWRNITMKSELLLPSVYIRGCLDDTMVSELKKIYSIMYPNTELSDDSLNKTVKIYTSLIYKGNHYNCTKKPIIFARSLSTKQPRPVCLGHFILHGLHDETQVQEHIFPSVSWLKEHHAKDNVYGKPVQVWWKDIYECSLDSNFIPLQLLICQSACCEVKFELQTVYAVIPVHNICSL